MADRDVLDVIEREIADEVRTRFPGDTVQRVRLLQYGDHPMIEPGDLWVRVLLAGDPEDYERILRAFQDAHEPAIEPFLSYLRDTVWEIRIVEFMCGEDPISREGAAGDYHGVGARCGHPGGGRTGVARPGHAGHADQGGIRDHACAGHPVGAGPHPRAAGLPAAPGSAARHRRPQ